MFPSSMFFAFASINSDSWLGVPLFFLFFWFFWLYTPVRLHRLGRQLIQFDAESILRGYERDFVLYLRAFKDDKLTHRVLDYQGAILVMTEEEQMMRVLQEIGPTIAIGKPGSELPGIGAGRHYVEDSEWQDVVGRFIKRARIVVIRAAETVGLQWELKFAREALRPEQLIITLPTAPYIDYKSFLEQATKQLFIDMPEFDLIGPPQYGLASSSGLVFFDDKWKANFSPFITSPVTSSLLGPWYAPYEATFRYAFKPVFENLFITWKKPRFHFSVVIFLIVFMTIITLVGLLAFKVGTFLIP